MAERKDMRLQKRCPHFDDCTRENERLTETWGFNCPEFAFKKAAKFSECMRYEEMERVSSDNRTAGEREESVQR